MGIHFGSKKKLLVLFASPNGHGHTRKLLDSFLECYAQDSDWEIIEKNIYELSPHPCIGCRACAQKEGCAFSDLDELDKQLRSSDLLVIASPVYNSTFPAPMKAVLDRTQRYFEARFSLGKRPPIKKHREAVLLLTMGSQDDFAVEVTTYQLSRSFSVMNTQLSGCAVWDATDLGEERKGEAQQSARGIALEIKEKL